ncbi:MAG: hypothetical protein WEE89_11795 [Gemmatimonadota bacterium]
MRRAFGVGVVLLLLGVLSPDGLFAQNPPRSRMRGNYPNPFNPTTTIQFELFEEDFRGKPGKVTIFILNQLQQLVAIPTALESHPNGTKVENLTYPGPGVYEAYWDGTDRRGRKVASGVYFQFMVVNGERQPPKRMVVTK